MTEPHNPYEAPRADGSSAASAGATDTRGWILLAIPALGGLVAPFAVLFGGEWLATVVNLGVVVSTMLLVGDDARRWRLKSSRYTFGFFCLWLVFYPLYFHERAKRGAPRRLALALGAEALFLGGSTILYLLTGALGVR